MKRPVPAAAATDAKGATRATGAVRHRARVLRRGGITLTEVLISTGILALGLLGVAALFPVGGHYLRQGEVSNRADAIAQSALSDAVASGMLDPQNWLAHRQAAIGGAFASQYAFVRDFDTHLGSVLAGRALQLSSTDEAVRAEAIREVNLFAGSVFVIDPLGAAEAMETAPSISALLPAGRVAQSIGYVPASTDPDYAFASNTNIAAAGWYPWLSRNGAALPQPDDPTGQGQILLRDAWPIRRLSVTTGATPIARRAVAPMVPQAERLVMAGDDLAVDLGDDADLPSRQPWDSYRVSGGARQPAARQARREYSWCLTVVPTTSAARDALAADPASFNYDVSVVVFYKRVTGGPLDPTDTEFSGHENTQTSERQARAAVASTGIGGGQLRLFTGAGGELAGPAGKESPVERLRAGQWVMLFGPHPDSTSTQPLLFCQWYRVIALEEGVDDDGDGLPDPFVFVRGPDWPWAPGGDQTQAASGLANDLRAVIMPDVAAVRTRTMKLNAGAAWGID